jgi:septum site-determining protein MinC
MPNLIAIKGSKDGLRLQLDESAVWSEVLDALRDQIMLDIGERALSEEELAALLALMQQYGLRPETLASTARESRNAARAAGLTTRPLGRKIVESEERGAALFVQRTVRSGQVVRHHGHVTVLGDLNAGGEIIAGGNVLVWGRLRGTVHAGALGDREAIIGALELMPTQLRIADLIARAPEGHAQRQPEIARVVDAQISVETWDYRK